LLIIPFKDIYRVKLMIEHSLQIDFADDRGLQEQLREALVSSILASRFLPEEALPSCRNLSEQLGI
jgi:GntR family transcriptional regulator/MocR family aminotransferase